MSVDNFSNLNMAVFSFDIFDTVLTRKTATPLGIFFLMQHKLLPKDNFVPSLLLQDFVSFRIKAEKIARQRTKNEEITILQIYNELAQQFSLSQQVQKFLIDLELSEELNSVYANPQILRIIDYVRGRKTRIVFASDTYLPYIQIREMLEKVGALKVGDGLYVSSDLLVTKSTGNLFRHMLKQEQCQPSSLMHMGDNVKSDVEAARKVGICALHYGQTKLNRYESAILGEDLSVQSYELQLLSGASREARISSNKRTSISRELYCLGANIAGPIFVIFVLWLLREALYEKYKDYILYQETVKFF